MDLTGSDLSNGRWLAIRHSSGSDGYARGGAEEAYTSESQRVLVSDARLSGGPLALTQTLQQLPEATFVPDHHTLSSNGSRTLYIRISGASAEQIDDALMLDSSVVVATFVETFPDCLVYRIDLADDAILVAPTSVELGARLISVRGSDGVWNARLQFPDRDALVALRKFCGERGIRFGIDTLYETEQYDAPSTDLTERQLEALRTAFESGYYEIPRQRTQDELAQKLGISTTAVSHRLRRATAQLVREVLDDLGDRRSDVD